LASASREERRRIWGTVTELGPGEFALIVYAVPDPPGQGHVERELAPSREDALLRQPSMGFDLAVRIATNVDRIINTEYAE
jgi:hypothetical protein